MPSKLASVALFAVDAATPQRVLTEATQRGLDAARAALAPDGSIEATGRAGSAREGRRRIRIELSLVVTDPTAALVAERAFTEAFLARVRATGARVEQV